MFALANLYILWRNRAVGHLSYCSRRGLTPMLRSLADNRTISAVFRRRVDGAEGSYAENVLYRNTNFDVLTKERVLLPVTEYVYYLSTVLESAANGAIHLQVKMVRPENSDEFVRDVMGIPPQSRVEISNICTPQAWLSGHPFHIVCLCSAEKFVVLTNAFLSGYLVTNELLQIESISTVDVIGTPINPTEQPPHLFGSLHDDHHRDALWSSYSQTLTSNSTKASEGGGDEGGGDVKSNHTMDTILESPKELEDEVINTLDRSITEPIRTRSLTKSPNILVYTGKKFAASVFNEIRNLLVGCIGPNSYTVYHLKHDQVQTSPWQDNCQLVVLAYEQLHDGVDSSFAEFFYSGGRILSFCSDLDKDFCNRELNVRPNHVQVVKAQYGQSSLDVIQGRHHYTDTRCPMPGVTLTKLALNSAGKSVVLEASNSAGGACIFSQLHLEKRADQASVDSEMLTALTHSESLRKAMVGDLLLRLGIEREKPDSREETSTVTPCHILCAHSQEVRQEFIQRISSCHPTKIRGSVLTIPKVGDYQLSLTQPTDILDTFDWTIYRDSLTSTLIGNTLLYQATSITTQSLVEPFLFSAPAHCGMAAIASRQISGIGRGSNAWLSPGGSLSLSMHIRIDMSSSLGQCPALIQTVPAAAVCRILESHLSNGKRQNDFRVLMKWPNDLYYRNIKIGGVVVKSTILQNTLHAVVGIGVNVKNAKPTVNINDIVRDFNAANSTRVAKLSIEYMAARICSDTESLIQMLNRDKTEFMNVYYKHWMHSGCRVDVPQENAKGALILGLDGHGFLKLQRDDGSTFSVQPDGNSFDIMHNLIKVK